MEEEDARREAARAASECLQPNFVPKSNRITSAHLSKLQELHGRRLQIKSKSQTKNKIKENGRKSHGKDINVDRVTSSADQDSSGVASASSLKEEPPLIHPVSTQKKPRKLHWGLDTKERWEMKANM